MREMISNSVEIMRNGKRKDVVGQGIDAAGLDHGGSAGVLDFAMDGEEGFLGDGEAPLFEELRATMALETPVSSSRLMKTNPFAVPGR